MKASRWQLAQPRAELLAQICGELRIPELLARCLVNRGCGSVEEAKGYLEPKLASLSDPFLLPDIGKAVDRLLVAHEQQERFVIFGDYDVDGVTATAILSEFFEELGWHCCQYLPHRMEEGYGLSRDGVENCLKRFDVKLMLAVDCGSKDSEVISDLLERGVEVIVLDHHQVCSPSPPAIALVNPQLLSTDLHLRNLCSAGLAFKLVHAILKRCRILGWARAHAYDIKKCLDLVALGTIADIVALQGENRILARIGLERLGCSSRIGIQELKKVSGIKSSVNCHAVGYQLAPRLNAAGRLETALDALELLRTKDSTRAVALAKALDDQNRERQSLEKRIAEQVIAAVRAKFNPSTDYAIVEGDPNWHLGVVGIVASRVVREFYRPVLILGSDGSEEWRGSGRSIEGFDMAAGLRQCGDLLLKHGGHAMAAGVTMASSRLSDLRQRINNLVKESVPEEALQPRVRIDAEVSLAEINLESLQLMGLIHPVGQGNPAVQFSARELQLRGEPKRFGGTQQHLRFYVTDGTTTHQAVWWNCPETALPAAFDLAFAPELSEYNGTVGIQLKVLDYRSVNP